MKKQGYYRHALTCLMAVLTWQCTTVQSRSTHVQGTEVEAVKAASSMAEVCTSDALLLTRFEAKRLYGSPLPPECCAPGVLPEGEQWRCEHDWPSSDVPSCTLWTETSAALATLLKATPSILDETQIARAQANEQTLAQWAKTQHGCLAEHGPDEGACDAAWLTARLDRILQSPTKEGCHTAYDDIRGRVPQCIEPMVSLMAADLKDNGAQSDLVLQLLYGGLNGHEQEAAVWQAFVLGVRTKRIDGCVAQDGAQSSSAEQCALRIDGGRPTGITAMACGVFGSLGATEPAKALARSGMSGHALRPCVPYLVHFGLNEPTVHRALISELEGKPGSNIRSALIGRGAALLPHLGALAQTQAAMTQDEDGDGPNPGHPCLSLWLVSQLEAQGVIAVDAGTAKDETRPRGAECVKAVETHLKQLRVLQPTRASSSPHDWPRPKERPYCPEPRAEDN